MTRPAEALTIEIDGKDGVWCLDRLFVVSDEARLVRPEQFQRWAADEWLSRHAGGVSRALRLASHPIRISTALRSAAVRFHLRGALRRRWVPFSGVEGWLRDVELPGATVDPSPLELCLVFRVPSDEPPLELEDDPLVFRCSTGNGVHWYRDRDDRGRRLSEVG